MTSSVRWLSWRIILLGVAATGAATGIGWTQGIADELEAETRIADSAEELRRAVSPEVVRLAAKPRRAATVARPVETKVESPAEATPDASPIQQTDEVSKLPEGEVGEESRLKPLTPAQVKLRDKIRHVLGYYYGKKLNTRDHNPWEMMHAIIAYGVQTEIHRGAPNGQPVNAVSYMCWNGPCHGIQLLFMERDRVNARKGPYVQGHYAQFLAILAQSRVPIDYPLTVGKKNYAISDLLETEKWTCDNDMELTFKLIAFSHYCDTDMTWRNFRGEEWSLPKIIHAELAAPILSNAACGGTHRLTGFAYAVRNRKRQGKPITGEWLRAEQYLNEYHRYTLALQNSDGSFSTEWFRKREAKPDLDRRLQTSGHILEWMVYSLPVEQLDQPQVVKAVDYVATLLLSGTSRKWEIGPLGHAIHSLAIYNARRYKPLDISPDLAKSKPADAPVLAPLPESTPDLVAPEDSLAADEEIGEVTITDEGITTTDEEVSSGPVEADDVATDALREARRRPLLSPPPKDETAAKPRGRTLFRWREQREAEIAEEGPAPPPSRDKSALAQQPSLRGILGGRPQPNAAMNPEAISAPRPLSDLFKRPQLKLPEEIEPGQSLEESTPFDGAPLPIGSDDPPTVEAVPIEAVPVEPVEVAPAEEPNGESDGESEEAFPPTEEAEEEGPALVFPG